MSSNRRYYPIFLDLEGKRILVVGGGRVAQRKIVSLVEHGALVQVIAKELNTYVASMARKGLIEYAGQEFEESHLEGVFLVIAATDDASLNRLVSDKAMNKGLLVNAVDQPSECNFIVPSVLRRGDLVVAVSTSGKSPAFARKVREDLEKHLGNEFELFLTLMGNIRKRVLSQGFTQERNRELFEELVKSQLLGSIRANDWGRAASIISKVLGRTFSPEEIIDYAGMPNDRPDHEQTGARPHPPGHRRPDRLRHQPE
jgi:precorrin-2 dehydrogenase/sirohydrochlorin ferrochelatase